MILKNIKIQKLISSLLIVAIFIPSLIFFVKPKQAEAVADVIGGPSNIISSVLKGIGNALIGSGNVSQATTATTAVKTWYGEILKQVLMAVARKVLQEITKSTVTWINNGFHGSPLFLENSSSFFEDIVKSEVKAAVDMYGYDSVRFPYGKDFAINTINAYRSKLEDNAAYSLSKVMTDPVQLYNYQNNFNVGGWNAFLVNTQYPQNNYLGFQMMANEQLAGKVTSAPTANNAITKVKETLQQGMGFLSPQTCPSNPNYNNGTNEFQRPSFNMAEQQKWYNEQRKIIENADGMTEQEKQEQIALLDKDFKEKVETDKANWTEENTCPGGLVATTPGSVVSSQITNALGSNFRQSELGAAMGNSLSTIFDALLNKFIGDGLNSLASKKNTKPTEDDWSYNGLTLGSPSEGSSSSWDIGPDEEIILDKFKKQLHGKTIVMEIVNGVETPVEKIGNTGNGTYVPGDIANLELEIILINEMPKLMNSTNPSNPGIVQLTEILDQCVPGPDKAWENRLKEEQERVSKVIVKEQSSEDDTKVKASSDLMKELKFTIDSFKDWITIKTISELPGSILFIDAINGINDFPAKIEESSSTKQRKAQTLARLKAIAGNETSPTKTGLATLTTQPEPGSAEEKILILFKKQYNSLRTSISSSYTIESARSELDTLKDYSSNLKKLITQCNAERVAAGWNQPGGKESKQNNQITEIAKFCSIPIVSGYSHGEIVREDDATRGKAYTFNNPNDNDAGNPGFEDLPMVNAEHVYGDIVSGGFLGLGSDDKRISIGIDCNTVFKANKTDYTHAGEDAF